MPKAPAKRGLFGWRHGKATRSIARSSECAWREMEAESVAKSIEMLKALLDGNTYQAVAKESGLTRSAVEQRVKALARDVQTIVGVEGVDEDEVPTASAMRARRDGYLEALEHYHPQHRLSASKRSRALTTE